MTPKTPSSVLLRPATLFAALLLSASGVTIWVVMPRSAVTREDQTGESRKVEPQDHPSTASHPSEAGRSSTATSGGVEKRVYSRADGALLQYLFGRGTPADLAQALAALGPDGARACLRALQQCDGRDARAIDLLIALAGVGTGADSVTKEVMQWWQKSGAPISDRFVIRALAAGGSVAARGAAAEVARQVWDRWRAGSVEDREAGAIFANYVIDELATLALPESVDLLESIITSTAGAPRTSVPALGNAPAQADATWADSLGKAAWRARIASASGPAIDRILAEIERGSSTVSGRALFEVLPVALRDGGSAELIERLEPWVLSTLEMGTAAEPDALAMACRISFLFGESGSNGVLRILEESSREGVHGAAVVIAMVQGTVDGWRRAHQPGGTIVARGLFDIVEKLTEKQDPGAELRGSLVEALVMQGEEEDIERVIRGLQRTDPTGAAVTLSKLPIKWFAEHTTEMKELIERMESKDASTPGAAVAAQLAAERWIAHVSEADREAVFARLKRSTFHGVARSALHHELDLELAALGAPPEVTGSMPASGPSPVSQIKTAAIFDRLRELAESPTVKGAQRELVLKALESKTGDGRYPIEPVRMMVTDPSIHWTIRLALFTGLAKRSGDDACRVAAEAVSTLVPESVRRGPEFERDLWWVVSRFAMRAEENAPSVVQRAYLERLKQPATADLELEQAFQKVGQWLAGSRGDIEPQHPAVAPGR